ncbi:MAG TPA: hypothetical protein VFN35_15470 [Ktedonobacteraceae bacterium]|nr:hypothetical protein [Ktedonobacteraceae bacterium]
MKSSLSVSEQTSSSRAFIIQRYALAACIMLAPLSLTLYILAWPENPAPVILNNTMAAPIQTSMMAGPLGNTLHFIGAVAASFFLPLGYLGMSLLGMRRSPWLATLSAALSLIGWIPWSGLIGIDALAYDIAVSGSTPQLAEIWNHFNGDPTMATYLLIYVIGHLVSAVLIAILLGRLHLIPAWAAWAFALSSPLTMGYFAIHVLLIRYILRYAILASLLLGAAPAALAMLKTRGQTVSVEEV